MLANHVVLRACEYALVSAATPVAMIFLLMPGTFSSAETAPVDAAVRKSGTEVMGKPAATRAGATSLVMYFLLSFLKMVV